MIAVPTFLGWVIVARLQVERETMNNVDKEYQVDLHVVLYGGDCAVSII